MPRRRSGNGSAGKAPRRKSGEASFTGTGSFTMGASRRWRTEARGAETEVPHAIRRAVQNAKRELLRVPVVNGTIPFEVVGKYGASRVIMRPASPGTGVIAGSGVRAGIESGGVRGIRTKPRGRNNSHHPGK